MTILRIKKVRKNAIIPTHGSKQAAGLDLYANGGTKVLKSGGFHEIHLIPPGETKLIPTGIAIELPENTFGAIYPRSGLATKRGLRLANCVAVIDSDYRGEVMVAIHNDSAETQTIEQGDRIAQLIVQPYYPVDIVETTILSDTERGKDGFGSTGMK